VTGASDEPDRPADEGGDPACWLGQVCPECGRILERPIPRTCPHCGTALPTD
jgi:rubrerythrin